MGWAAVILAAAIGVWGACSKGLDALSPFPCAKDGSCPDGFVCQSVSGGATSCVTAFDCTPGLTPCNGACVDLTKDDPMNCGGCGNVCPAGSACCQEACVALDSDANNCGSCGNACKDRKSCVGGACACTPGQKTCAGVCADPQTDSLNCGACGNACGNGSLACVGGACQACPPQMTLCNGTCVDTEGDPANCGFCGNACGPGTPCQSGACGCISCGTTTCNTCNDPSWVIYCDASAITCCAPDHPFFCPSTEPEPCWDIPIDCSAAVMCSDGGWHGCLPGQVFDCTSMTCT